MAGRRASTRGGDGDACGYRQGCQRKRALARSRDLLLALYRDNPKQLGDFGFVVDDAARPAKKPAAK